MQNNKNDSNRWQFWVDRGGTFTDVVAKTPSGELLSKKLLSENPEAYKDAALQGIRDFLEIGSEDPIPSSEIQSVKMGTTVATNALLERKGEETLLLISAGFEDILEIGHQARPETFALNIVKHAPLYKRVVAVNERVLQDGSVQTALDIDQIKSQLIEQYEQGFRSIAIVLMHAYKYPLHEQKIAGLVREIGYQQISCSHEVSPLSKIVPRGETTVVDAYLSPILRRYIDQIEAEVGAAEQTGKLLFMQSSGGLIDSRQFQGKDAILSGPAGGVIGAVRTAEAAGFNKIIGFDMGGTSTDVMHYAGELEQVYETEVAGAKMRVPMMHIHTVAAGGGSLLDYDGVRFRVGPGSAGAHPGPVCYRRGGALSVTDINVCLGKIQPEFFPKIFGPNQDQELDREATISAFQNIAEQLEGDTSAEQIAEGFLDIAIEHMVQAIKKISVARGYDVTEYTLNCFGGAGGQHACLVAESLGIKRVLLHPFSGVLSAYGMGLADIATEKIRLVDEALSDTLIESLKISVQNAKYENEEKLVTQGLEITGIQHQIWARLHYKNTDTRIKVRFCELAQMQDEFEHRHLQNYGFLAKEKPLYLESIIVNSFGGSEVLDERVFDPVNHDPQTLGSLPVYFSVGWQETPFFRIEELRFGHEVSGPAIIVENTGTIVIEPGWRGIVNQYQHLILEKLDLEVERSVPDQQRCDRSTEPDPVTLELFNNLFMSIAEQMGLILQNTSQSVNIKERLDFSCAIFNPSGDLVANAPHVPVHLGSMDFSVKVIIESGETINPGDVFVQNNPYNGGSHLPDITVITPVFDESKQDIIFYVASRAHHEDVGGISPGSMSPNATTIAEEGVILDNLKLVDRGAFLYDEIRFAFESAQYPARNIEQNIADLMAQIAANKCGVNELNKVVAQYGLKTVHAYMGFIQDAAELAVKNVIATLNDGSFRYQVDSGAEIHVQMKVNHNDRSAILDFSGTSPQLDNNFNAPKAITHAAVIYVFRCLLGDNIPLNAGCMRPLQIIIPENSLLNPSYPAAVVAGNVETSQAVTNALFGALEVLGSSQGTMNNLTFGNDQLQYYETICSGAPAGKGFDGVAAVHTHMTNTRLTDPEILESRYPVVLDEFSIRRGSGGKGQWNAGDGILRKIRFLEPLNFSILSDHRRVPPFGTKGGEVGELGRNWVIRKNGSEFELQGCAQGSLEAGDTICIATPTGGGYGKAENRDNSDDSET